MNQLSWSVNSYKDEIVHPAQVHSHISTCLYCDNTIRTSCILFQLSFKTFDPDHTSLEQYLSWRGGLEKKNLGAWKFHSSYRPDEWLWVQNEWKIWKLMHSFLFLPYPMICSMSTDFNNLLPNWMQTECQ